jgi:hypothetical protein
MIRVDGDTAHVTTVSEALQVCDMDGVEHVVVDDCLERVKLAKIIGHMEVAGS